MLTKGRDRAAGFLGGVGGYFAVVLVLAAVIALAVDTWILGAGAIAIVLAIGALGIGRLHPRRFFWYGLAIFVSVVLYGAALEAIRTKRDPSVQPVALILKDGRGIAALYVTETKDRFYVARVNHQKRDASHAIHGDGRLFWFSKDQVTNYSVGPLMHVDEAARRKYQLLKELTATQHGVAATTTPGGSKAPTSGGSGSTSQNPGATTQPGSTGGGATTPKPEESP